MACWPPLLQLRWSIRKYTFLSFQLTFRVQATRFELNMAEKDNNSCHGAKSDEIKQEIWEEKVRRLFPLSIGSVIL